MSRESGRSGEGIQTLTDAECYQLLSSGVVGRIAFFDATGIQLVPVSYVLAGRKIIFRTSLDGLLGHLASGEHDVAFEVDYHDPVAPHVWSVLIKGSVSALDPEAFASWDIKPRLSPFAGGDGSCHLQLNPIRITGRRVSRTNRHSRQGTGEEMAAR